MRILKTLFTAVAAAVLMLGGLLALVATVATAALIFLGRQLFRPAAGSPVPSHRNPRPGRSSASSDAIEVSATEVPDRPSPGDPSSRVGLTSGRP